MILLWATYALDMFVGKMCKKHEYISCVLLDIVYAVCDTVLLVQHWGCHGISLGVRRMSSGSTMAVVRWLVVVFSEMG